MNIVKVYCYDKNFHYWKKRQNIITIIVGKCNYDVIKVELY